MGSILTLGSTQCNTVLVFLHVGPTFDDMADNLGMPARVPAPTQAPQFRAKPATAPKPAPVAAPAGPSPDDIALRNAQQQKYVTPGTPEYKGPGWVLAPDAQTGILQLVRSSDPTQVAAQNAFEVQSGAAGLPPQPTVPTLDSLNAAVAPQPKPNLFQQSVGQVGGQLSFQGGTPIMATRAPVGGPSAASRLPVGAMPVMPGPGSGAPPGPASVGGATSQNPEAGGPAEVDRANIDRLLGNVSKATSGLAGLAATNQQYSAAQAQLAQGTAQTQANTLALARSGNRRDAAALGAQALQRNVELGGEATRSSALLRAQEEDQNRKFKLDAYKAAGDLGLNTAALEVDVNSMNMQAATSYLNNLFETNRLGLQLNEAEAARATNFIRDMALVEKDYYAMSVAERQSFRDDLTRRYGIDKQTELALKQLDKSDDLNWGQLAAGFVSGGAQGATAGIMALSDERMKTDIADTTDAEFGELLSKFPSKTYTYKGRRAEHGKQFGGMAQDLLSSELGRGMVDSTSDGTLVVDAGKAGMAALSGLSKVWQKLKALEASL